MKKFLIGIVIAAVALWGVLQIFNYYNANNIMSNQTVFKIYMNVPEADMDEYFGLEKGTYDPENHLIVCKYPVQAAPFKQQEQVVDFEIDKINCNEKYKKGDYIKYDETELNDDGNATLLIINKNSSRPIGMIDNQTEGENGNIVASREVYLNYQMGVINHIVLSKDRTYDYCNQ